MKLDFHTDDDCYYIFSIGIGGSPLIWNYDLIFSLQATMLPTGGSAGYAGQIRCTTRHEDGT